MNWGKRLRQLWGMVRLVVHVEEDLKDKDNNGEDKPREPPPAPPLPVQHPQKRKRPVRKKPN